MKKAHIILLLFIMSLYGHEAYAQFIVAQDTVRGKIDFSTRPGDLNEATIIPNDTVFYMLPVDPETDPWRYVDYYLPDRSVKSGYIHGRYLLRIDDYEMVEVERLSSHGSVSFKNDDVRVNVSVTAITSKDTSIKKKSDGGYTVNGVTAEGTVKGEAPKLRYQSISVSIRGRTIVFPRRVYDYLLEPEIDNMAVYYNPQKEIVYILANNGGTEAYYNALWAVSRKGVANVYVFDPERREVD